MRKWFIIVVIILTCNSLQAQVNHFVSMNYCGASYNDKHGFNFSETRNQHFSLRPMSYTIQYKRFGVELFFNSIKSEYIAWNKTLNESNSHDLVFRERANLGVCVQYSILKKKWIDFSLSTGLAKKSSSDYIYVYSSIPSCVMDFNEEIGYGIVTGANAKIFFQKRAYFNATVRQMNLIDNSKFQRNTFMTEFGIGVKLGKLVNQKAKNSYSQDFAYSQN